MGEKGSVFSFKSSKIIIGSYECNPDWVDFGKKGISMFIQFPNFEEKENLDIEFTNIKSLKRFHFY